MLVLAHRGLCRDAPENTLAAFEAARAAGTDGVETDVRLSADGLPVLFHDRAAPDGRAVSTLTRDELSAVCGHQVPTLSEALAAFGDMFFDVEVKPHGVPAAVAAAVAAALAPHVARTPGRLLVSSVHAGVLTHLAGRLDVSCGLVLATRPLAVRSVAALVAGLRLDALVWDYEVLDAELVEEATALGLRTFAWGMVSPAEVEHATSLGVDGVIVDA